MHKHPEAAATETLLPALHGDAATIVSTLHALALGHGCTFRADAGETAGSHTLVYSGMELEVRVDGEAVTLSVGYDIRSFLDFYRNHADDATKAILFGAATPCCFCIDDKCTTLLTDRRVYLGKKVKQLCGPFRHRLDLPVTPANVELMGPILDMAFRYCVPEMHADVRRNDVTYAVRSLPEQYVVGYHHRSTMLSTRTEDFISQCFADVGDGRPKLDKLAQAVGRTGSPAYVGVTSDFVDGLDYTYVLGVLFAKDDVPADLPEGVVAVPLPAGEYAAYNSSAGDYASVWRHFRDHFFAAEQKGFDVSRPWFEHFRTDGSFHDVSIPVAAGLPANSGERKRVVRTSDVRLAGYVTWQETDFPLYRDAGNVAARLRQAFPDAERLVHAYTHNKPGQPACEKHGVEIDRFDAVPEGMEEMTIHGGYWHATSYPYPVIPDYLLFEAPYEPRREIDLLNHPREFIFMEYNGRGAYAETLVPIRVAGKHIVEPVERPEWRLVGKQVALPHTIISDADIATLCDLPANAEKGSYTLTFRFEKHNDQYFDAGPVIAGVEVDDLGAMPEGMQAFTLPGGKYVRLSEAQPNGELDWRTPGFAVNELPKITDYQPDFSRPIYVHQTGYGKAFSFYVPVK